MRLWTKSFLLSRHHLSISRLVALPNGLEGARMMLNAMWDAAFEMKIEDIIAEDDRVAVRWTMTGIYRLDPNPGYPSRGRRQLTDQLPSIGL